MKGILEIVQVNKEAEPSFEVWLRHTILAPESASRPEAFVLKNVRDQLTPAGSAAPPANWPIPADSESNLAQALPWYLEQFVQQPTDMGAQRARYVLHALHDWGKDVFSNLFTTEQARGAYDTLADSSLSQRNRIEIHSTDPQVLAWPWEVLLDHHGCPVGRMMAVERRYGIAVQGPDTSITHHSVNGLNVLLVTARQGTNDVDYRLVGRPIASALIPLRLTMLRPPTLENLRQTIHSTDHYWDVLHFDCHGWWGSLDGGAPQGHLVLEDNNAQPRPVSVGQLLDALGDCCAPHVVLNACRSAMPDGQTDSPFASVATALLHHPNVHDVTAMAYNLHVDAAKPFLMGFYCSLNSGENVCTAVENGHFSMILEPIRTCVGGTVTIQDWFVPVVYRRAGADPEGDLDRAPVFHLGYDRSNQPYWNERFFGRSGEMFVLDRCAEKDFSLLLIHGLAGQGKTTLLREFLWWRERTGDSRASIWIDFERMHSAHDVLWHMAQALPNPPDRTIDIDGLESCLAQSLAANPSWIVWDHLNAVCQQGEGGSLNHFVAEDRTRLASWIGRLAGSKSAVLAASRGPETWLLAEPGCASLPLGGLKDQDRWQLVNQLLSNTAKNGDLEATSSARDGLHQLVFYLAGHPLMTIDAISRVRLGQSAQVIHDDLRADLSRVRPWQLEQTDASRLEQSLSCLDHASVRPVLPLLSLHEEMIDESMFRCMMRQIYGDDSDNMVDFAFIRLEAAGLLHKREFLHPAVGGALRCKAELAPSDEVRGAFIETIADRLARPVENSHFTMGTLHNAMLMAAAQELPGVAIAIGRHIVQFCINREDYERAITVQHKLVAICESNPNDEEVVSTLLGAAQTARLARNLDQSERWLTQAETRVHEAQNELPHEVQAELHYQRGKLAELYGDIDAYRDAIVRAQRHADQSSDKQLVGLIAYELAQLRIRSGDLAAVPEHAADMLYDSAPLHLQAGANRAQAQAHLAQGNYDEARVLLQRAIALDDQAGNNIGKAMNISLLGEVEGLANNLPAAKIAFENAVALFEVARDRRSAAVTYHQWAKTLYKKELMEEAGEYFIQSAGIFSEIGDQATFATVAQNFRYYLGELQADMASYMALKWISAKLPGSIVMDHMSEELDASPPNKLEPGRTDQ